MWIGMLGVVSVLSAGCLDVGCSLRKFVSMVMVQSGKAATCKKVIIDRKYPS